MITKNQEKIAKANELLTLIQKRLEMEKQEEHLKAYFKTEMGTEMILEAGNVVLILESKSRTSLDKKALEAELGHDVIVKFEKTTTYQCLNVKKAA